MTYWLRVMAHLALYAVSCNSRVCSRESTSVGLLLAVDSFPHQPLAAVVLKMLDSSQPLPFTFFSPACCQELNSFLDMLIYSCLPPVSSCVINFQELTPQCKLF